MKERPLANCERDFILQVIKQKKRLDGRKVYDYRNIKIFFGIDHGCCHVNIGETKVMAQVTCNIVEPKQTRPNEGSLMINLEFNHIACPGYEPGRLSQIGVQINRILERCIKECRCVDLESLCVIAEKQVWEIRVDVKVLNHDGNILDACSLAAITALAHFKRPDVSVDDGKITVHPADEKAYIPLSVHHMPICTSFSFFHSGDYLLLDTTYEEERVREGHMVIAMNKHREICALHMNGTHLLPKDQVLRCTNIAASKVLALTELIQLALQKDTNSRERGAGSGSVELNIRWGMHSLAKQVQEMKLPADPVVNASESDEKGDSPMESSEGEETQEMNEEQEVMEGDEPVTQEIGSGGVSSWNVEKMDEENEEMSEQTKVLARKRKRGGKKKVKVEARTSDSEEEEVVKLETPG